jgi:phosphate/sulfate permease
MINEIIKTLFELWKYDVEIFSEWWLYAPVLIPAMAYLLFFFLKWTVLTAPIWLPFYIVLNCFRKN